MPEPMLSEDVPADLVTAACEAAYGTPLDPGDDRTQIARALAAVLPAYAVMMRAEWFRELFGDPVARLKEPMRPDSREEIVGRMLDYLTLDELRRVAQTAAARIARGEG